MLISYAQNGEDILLYRCFKDVKSGFYIDVGANHPIEESVTKYFYDQGWQGVNIEPEPISFQLISKERPLDFNINKCVSCVEKELEFYQIKNTGLSSLLKSNATKAIEQGFTSNTIKVEGEKLTNILNSLNIASRQIEFLKIDTEGNEEDVIKSLDFKLYQPKVILVETVSPYLHENKSRIIDDLLITKDYKKVYFDGLNSYFLRLDQYEKLKVHFDTPVNIFDGFIKYKEFILIENNNILMKKIKKLEASLLLTSQIDNSVIKLLTDYNLEINNYVEKIKELSKRLSDIEQRNNFYEYLFSKKPILLLKSLYQLLSKYKQKLKSFLIRLMKFTFRKIENIKVLRVILSRDK